MSKEPYPGIDWSGPGSTVNRDNETGIRYGVISCNSLMPEAIYEAQEMDYGKPESHDCPDCGANFFVDCDWGATVTCPECEEESEVEMDDCVEPSGWSIDDGEYKVVDCLDNDAMIIKSPYYTYTQFCSPCVPGAGNLDNPFKLEFDGMEPRLEAYGMLLKLRAEQAGFAKTYCFGYDWFDEHNPCPYRAVFRVHDNSWVHPDQHNFVPTISSPSTE